MKKSENTAADRPDVTSAASPCGRGLAAAARICAACVTALYGDYLLVNLFAGNYNALLLPAAVIALALVPALLCGRLPRAVTGIFTAGMAFYLVTFAALNVFIAAQPMYGADETAEAAESGGETVVVFGCRTYDEPSATLKRRLDCALKLLEANEEASCIVTGGQGSNEPRTEASAMKEYLTDRGIDPTRITEEADSNSTVENIRNTLSVTGGGESPRLICVSNRFHLRRISILLRLAGWDGEVRYVGVDDTDVFTWTSNVVREYMAYVKLFVFRVGLD